jgi:hypothetical protein
MEFLPSEIEWWLIAQALHFAPAQCPFLLFSKKGLFRTQRACAELQGFVPNDAFAPIFGIDPFGGAGRDWRPAWALGFAGPVVVRQRGRIRA